MPIGDEVEERFASNYRARVGLGYRVNASRRVDVLYFGDWVRDTLEDTPQETARVFDIRYQVAC